MTEHFAMTADDISAYLTTH